MPPRNSATARQADRGGASATASDLKDKATPDVSGVIRKEIISATAELRKEFLKAGLGYKLLGGAGFAGYMALLFVSIAVWAALATVVASGTAAIIVAFIWAVTAAVLYVLSKREREADAKPRRASRAAGKRSGSVKERSGGLKEMATDLSGSLKRAVRR